MRSAATAKRTRARPCILSVTSQEPRSLSVGNLVETMGRLGHVTPRASLIYQSIASGRDAEVSGCAVEAGATRHARRTVKVAHMCDRARIVGHVSDA